MFSSNTSQVSSSAANYIEDVFSTWLYTGTGSALTINNGVDLAGKGGLVWLKDRSEAFDHGLFDTARGAGYRLISNSTAAENFSLNYISSFNSNGFSLGAPSSSTNTNGDNYVSWTFREQPKFFDVVTWTGDDNVRSIPHSLGSTPGCVIIKPYSGDLGGGSTNWYVWHRSVAPTRGIFLNLTERARDWDSGSPIISVDATHINILANSGVISATGQIAYVNTSRAGGQQYIAYIFAHDAGGFGLTGTDNVISCGSYTGNGSSANGPEINLGYEPQWLMVKRTDNAVGADWYIFDNMRGNPNILRANASGPENSSSAGTGIQFTATGFQPITTAAGINTAGGTFIYIAIRRGPMKTPTTGTSVFAPVAYSGTGVTRTLTTGFVSDFSFIKGRSGGTGSAVADRLRGASQILQFESTGAEFTDTGTINGFDSNTGIRIGTHSSVNASGSNYVLESFRRAPGFFDEVCYTGTGSNITLNHNLGAVPELMIFKTRTGAARAWGVYSSTFGVNKKLILNTTAAVANDSFFVDTTPTATVFYPGNADESNEGGNTYVAYLFASCPGVSKVGSFTGTGATQVINCGFTGGARFVLIKATSTTGNWLVWDTARGMIPANDPYLTLNNTAAEVTNTDWVDTATTGFELSNNAGNLANSNGVTYIFLAIA